MRPYYNYDQQNGGQRIGFRSGWTRSVKHLIIANAVVFLLQAFVAPKMGVEVVNGRPLSVFTMWFGFYGPNFRSGMFWQLVTYMFLHGNLWHLIFNMVGLFFFGGDVERQIGRKAFLTMYFLCGVGGAAISLVDPHLSVPIIGASGGVLGVLVAFALLYPNARIMIFPIFIPIRAMYLAIFYCFVTVAKMLAASQDGTAHWCHFGGMMVAVLIIKGRPFRLKLMNYLARKHEIGEVRRTEAEQAELDRILEKVHREGITSLSNRERDFLNTISKKKGDG